MWWLCVFLLLLELQIVEGTVGVQITPCTDSFVEVPLEESLTLNCKPLTQTMEWRLSMGDTYLLGKLENSTYVLENNFGNIFVVSNDDKGISLTINTRNILNVSMVNGTVQCNDLTKSSPSSSNCGLNYVYKPKPSNISCQAKADPNGDKLYCNISNFYSSRGIYTCQALREKDEEHSEIEELNTVNMVTSNVGRGPLVSGECHITTKPPETAGNYSYLVKISPGGSEIWAKLPDGGKWIEHFGTSTPVPSQAAIYNVPTVWLVAALILL